MGDGLNLKPWGTAAVVGDGSHNVLKLNREEHEAAIAARRLAKLENVGALEIKAQFAARLAESAQAEFELAQLVKSNGWLVANQAPPKRWPLILLAALVSVMLGLQVAMFVRSQHPPFPTSESAPKAGEGSKAVRERKGRAAP